MGALRFRWKEATLCSKRQRTLSTHNTGSTTQTEDESVEQFTFPNPTGNLPRNPSGQHKGLVTTDGPWDQNGLHSSIACVLDAEDGELVEQQGLSVIASSAFHAECLIQEQFVGGKPQSGPAIRDS